MNGITQEPSWNQQKYAMAQNVGREKLYRFMIELQSAKNRDFNLALHFYIHLVLFVRWL
jgi:hypothetical protein